MAEPDQAAIEKRARELAEQDGYPWQIEWKPVRLGATIVGQPYLDPERRQQYLDRALAELRNEARRETSPQT